MKNPYTVLGVSENDSDEVIKQKYRELVKKYHPDHYHDNPLADLAQEKMKEINEAYDSIQKMRQGASGAYGSDPGRNGGNSGYRSSYAGSDAYRSIREAIESGNLYWAEKTLNELSDRNAEWYYLKGCLVYRRGWLDEAARHFRIAVSMDPQNPEYRQALQNLEAQSHFNGQSGMDDVQSELCSLCSAAICANMLCRCC